MEDRQEPGVQEGATGGRPQNLGGYQIDAEIALIALLERSPRAARWWIDNAPRAFLPSSRLVFSRSACEVVPDAPEPPVGK